MEYVAKNQDKYLGQDFFYKQCCKKAVLSQPAARSQMLKDPKFAEVSLLRLLVSLVY